MMMMMQHQQRSPPSQAQAQSRRHRRVRRNNALLLPLAALLALAAAAAVPAHAAAAASADPRVARLRELQAASKDGLALFDEASFNELALSPDRPYHLVFFGSARRFMDGKLQLRKLKQEFVLAAKAFKADKASADSVFFVDMWHDDAAPVFQRLGLQSLPVLFHWGPKQSGKPGKRVALPDSARCGAGVSTYPWPAESIVDCVKDRTGLTAAPVDRPSIVKSPLFPLVALAALAGGGAVAWKLYNSPIARQTWVWALGALAVYGFSTSGGMYNIIRGMPLYIQRGNKIQWWLEGRSGQLGMEGFCMGSSYVVFSALISAMVYGLPHVKDAKVRGGLSVAAAAGAALVGTWIFGAYRGKTGMSMRSFF